MYEADLSPVVSYEKRGSNKFLIRDDWGRVSVCGILVTVESAFQQNAFENDFYLYTIFIG